jgi:hypothetical protein
VPDVTGTAATAQVFQTVAGAGYESYPGGGFLLPNQPNIVDFLNFIGTTVQIPVEDLPLTSPWPQYALNQALILTPRAAVGVIYTLAVYNCATHILLSITPDQSGRTYFTNARSNAGFDLITGSTGLITSTSDQGTSVSIAQPNWAVRMTVSQLGFMKTPWGREFLGYIQSYGPSIVGLT